MNLDIRTAAPVGTTGESTYAVMAGVHGDVVQVSSGVGDVTTNYAGTTLIMDGSTSLLDVYDNGGGNTTDLTNSKISSNLYLSDGKGSGLALGFYSVPVYNSLTGVQGDVVDLNAVGSGVAHVFTSDEGGDTFFNGFTLGHDILDMTLSASDFTISGSTDAYGNPETRIVGASPSDGVILFGLSSADVSAHASTAMVSDAKHLYIT
jgi:hypothetical protein